VVSFNTAWTCAKGAAVVLAVTGAMVHPALAQSSQDAAVKEYAQVLQRIADLKTTIAHQEVYIDSQKAEMESLRAQIAEVKETVKAIDPMLDKIQVAVAAEIESDLPFNAVERFGRLDGFRESLADGSGAAPIVKMRRALSILEAEVAYGQTVTAYNGDNPDQAKAGQRFAACEEDSASSICGLSEDQAEEMENAADADKDKTLQSLKTDLKDGYYLRYGRLALAYAEHDYSEVLLFDPKDKAWQKVSGAQEFEIRRAVKSARGEAAPAMLNVPVLIGE